MGGRTAGTPIADPGLARACEDPATHPNATTEIRYGYDRGRLLCVDYPTKEDVKYLYGPASFNVTGTGNFARGRLLSVQDESGTESYTYGKMGEMTSSSRTFSANLLSLGGLTTNVQSQKFNMAYDSFGRQLSLQYPDGETLRYFYDLGGNVTAAKGRGKFISGASNTTAEIPYVTNIRYDKFGNKIHAEFSSGAVSNWSYDPLRVRLQNAQTTARLLKKNASGNALVIESVPLQNMVYGYDNVGNPTSMESQLAVPDPNNNGMIPGKGFWSFTYDTSDRLTGVAGCTSLNKNHASTYQEDFTYDNIHNITVKVRNRTEKNITGNGNTFAKLCQGTVRNERGKDDLNYAYSYNTEKPHQIASISNPAQPLQPAIPFGFDANGNMVSKDSALVKRRRDFLWDDDNKLVQVNQASSTATPKTLIRNVYDADGLRAKKYSDTTGETLFVSPFFDILFKQRSTNGTRANQSIAKKHVFVGSWRVASSVIAYDSTLRGNVPESDSANQLGRALHFHSDHLGSVGLVTINATVVPSANQKAALLMEHTEYYADGDAWVERSQTKEPLNGYKFSGKFFDPETGLYDFGARFYDPKLSLWLSNDPALMDGSSEIVSMTLSSYGYASQSPSRLIDPDGREVILQGQNTRKVQEATSAFNNLIGEFGKITSSSNEYGDTVLSFVPNEDQPSFKWRKKYIAARILTQIFESQDIYYIINSTPKTGDPIIDNDKNYDPNQEFVLDTQKHEGTLPSEETGHNLAGILAKANFNIGKKIKTPSRKNSTPLGTDFDNVTHQYDAIGYIEIDFSFVETANDKARRKRIKTVKFTPEIILMHELVHVFFAQFRKNSDDVDLDGYRIGLRKYTWYEKSVRRFENKYLRKNIGLPYRDIDVQGVGEPNE